MPKDAARPAMAPPDLVALAVIALAGVGLIFHAYIYRFLTDDAFISFRYARNLANGYGLVFNPGFERVEGATNFLWVLLIAGLQRLGVTPELSSVAMSLMATIVLFALVVRFVWKRVPAGRKWIATLPAVFLAATRSIAVWTSSGLETRLFECLLVAGALRLVEESEARDRGTLAVRSLSPWLFGLAALTRPDGLLVGGSVLLAVLAYRATKIGRLPRQEAVTWWPFAALVAGQLIFRLSYYGNLLPNTYYAKVGSTLHWTRGLRYILMFALEYGALLWIPAIVLAVRARWKSRAHLVPIVFGAVVIPHALFVMAIGGDHFEYRPLDLYFPFAFILVALGVAAWTSVRGRTAISVAYAALVSFGLAWFPTRSHLDFPSFYWAGFPGNYIGKLDEADRFLAVDRDPIFRIPSLRAVAEMHRALLCEQTAAFVGVRQEEHRLFLGEAARAADKLKALIDQGLVTPDVYVAMDCVGIIPYRTNVRTLDRLGLTDAHVAHSAFVSESSAHGKYATLQYAKERGVDFWSGAAVSLVTHVGANRVENAIRAAQQGPSDAYLADLGAGEFVYASLPQGLEATKRKFPRLDLRPAGDSTIVASYIRAAVPEFMTQVEQGMGGPPRAQRLGEICYLAGDMKSAIQVFASAARAWPDWHMYWMLALSRKAAGDRSGAEVALGDAVRVLRSQGDERQAAQLTQMFQSVRAPR